MGEAEHVADQKASEAAACPSAPSGPAATNEVSRREPRDFTCDGPLSPELLVTPLLFMAAGADRRCYRYVSLTSPSNGMTRSCSNATTWSCAPVRERV